MAKPADRRDHRAYLAPYREAVETHGPGFEATLWGSRDAQIRRFDVFLELADVTGCVVMDIGCGHGDFAAHLHERGVAFTRYVGFDAVAEVIESGRARKLPRCAFETVDVVTDAGVLAAAGADFAFISGTLNTMDDPTARAVVQAGFEASAQGIVFNFLSDRPHPRWRERDLTPARRFDTAAWIDWALGRTSLVSFTQAYLDGHDATIAMMHEGETPKRRNVETSK